MRGRITYPAAFALLLVLAMPLRGGADVPAGATWHEEYFPSSDGVMLHADVLLPAGLAPGDRVPTLLWVGPYANHSGSGITGLPDPPFDPTRSGPQYDFISWLVDTSNLFERGYALVIVDLRGFGASGGCSDFMGPGEQADAVAAVEWAASRPWSNGRVGMIGNSYPATVSTMAIAGRARGLEAVAINAAGVALDRHTASNGVHYGPDYFVPLVYGSDNLRPGTVNDSTEYHAAWAGGNDPRCVTVGTLESVGADPSTPFYRGRDWGDRLAGAEVPLLYAHGFLDNLVKPNMFLDWIPRMAGERRMWLGQWRHGSPVPTFSGRSGWAEAVMRHFDRTLLGLEVPEPDPPVVVQEGPSGRWRGELIWPPADAQIRLQTLLPGTYLDAPGNSGEELPPTESPGSALPLNGIGSWTFTPPLVSAAHLSGVPRVELRADGRPNAVVIALLYDVAPDGSALLVTRNAARLGTDGTAAFALFPQDWRFEPGHRIGVLLTGADGGYWLPLDRTLMPVHVRTATLSLPLLTIERSDFIDGARGPALSAKKPIDIDATTIRERTAPSGPS